MKTLDQIAKLACEIGRIKRAELSKSLTVHACNVRYAFVFTSINAGYDHGALSRYLGCTRKSIGDAYRKGTKANCHLVELIDALDCEVNN